VTERSLNTISEALERRYPGVICTAIECQISETTHTPGGTRWSMCFYAQDRETLIGLGLATPEQFAVHDATSLVEAQRHPSMRGEFGQQFTVYNSGWVTMDLTDDDRDVQVTKKLRRKVRKLLRPFVRGTWNGSISPAA
jgi:hypothetical protein